MLEIKMTPKGGSVPETIDNKAFLAALSTQILNNPDKIMLLNDKQYDYATLLINILLGAGLKNNAIYVDPVFGDDSTAEKNSLEKKYKTILAAQTAAIAGESIVVFPGNYVEGFLGKNGLTYSFPFGANVQCVWTGGNLNYNVTGFADFSYPSFSVINAFLNSNINVQCRSITCNALGFASVFASSNSVVNVQVMGDIVNTVGDGVMSTDATLYVNANRIIAPQRGCVLISGTTTVYRQIVYAKEIIVSTASGMFTWSAGGNQEVHAKFIRLAGNVTSGGIHIQPNIFPSIANVNIYGDIQDDSDIVILVSNNTGNLNYYGNISGVGNISVTGSSAQVRINGNVLITKDAGVVTMSGGIVEVKGRVKNLSNTANAHGFVINGGTPILNQTVIVTTDVRTNSLFAATPRNAIAYTGFANRVKHANVTILTGVLLVDANVQ